MSQSSWLVAGIVPGIERHPLKKLEPDEAALLRLLWRWRDEAAQKGRTIMRIAVAFEAGREASYPITSTTQALQSQPPTIPYVAAMSDDLEGGASTDA
jgi:hypothetical protein